MADELEAGKTFDEVVKEFISEHKELSLMVMDIQLNGKKKQLDVVY